MEHSRRHPQPETINQNLDLELIPGQVIFIHCDFVTPPHEKYLLLLGSDNEDFLLFIINSRINQFTAENEMIFNAQVEIHKIPHYHYLDHTSYINCWKVERRPIEEVRRKVAENINRIKGEISSEDREKVISCVQASDNISPRHKSIIIRELG